MSAVDGCRCVRTGLEFGRRTAFGQSRTWRRQHRDTSLAKETHEAHCSHRRRHRDDRRGVHPRLPTPAARGDLPAFGLVHHVTYDDRGGRHRRFRVRPGDLLERRVCDDHGHRRERRGARSAWSPSRSRPRAARRSPNRTARSTKCRSHCPSNASGTYNIAAISATSAGGTAAVTVSSGSGGLPTTGLDGGSLVALGIGGGVLLLAGGALAVATAVRRSRRS